ncbi:hypothetical protein T484DRAFT_1951466 [Baffinella frigidus]|nr:hypothetical protein T484DRAFT_1951466 [Cryptophyta sp. CCMP2293]
MPKKKSNSKKSSPRPGSAGGAPPPASAAEQDTPSAPQADEESMQAPLENSATPQDAVAAGPLSPKPADPTAPLTPPPAAVPAATQDDLQRRTSSGGSATSATSADARPPLELSSRGTASPAAIPAPSRDWVELAVLTGDKVNALLLASPAHRWAITLSIVLPGGKISAALSSPVAPKQVRGVVACLARRPDEDADDAPVLSLAAVVRFPSHPSHLRLRVTTHGLRPTAYDLRRTLVAGLRHLAAMDGDDVALAAAATSSVARLAQGFEPRQLILEVECKSEAGKVQITHRERERVSAAQAAALSSAVRRLAALQRRVPPNAKGPVGLGAGGDFHRSTLPAAIIAGILSWDRDM